MCNHWLCNISNKTISGCAFLRRGLAARQGPVAPLEQWKLHTLRHAGNFPDLGRAIQGLVDRGHDHDELEQAFGQTSRPGTPDNTLEWRGYRATRQGTDADLTITITCVATDSTISIEGRDAWDNLKAFVRGLAHVHDGEV